MAEIRDLSFLIDSPEYRQNAVFVTACYREILERDVEAEELFRWCRQLDGVYSRKSLIAALSGSSKFNNRFEIKDLGKYKKRAFIPRAIQHVINRLNGNLSGYDKGCYGLLPDIRLEFDYPQYKKGIHEWQDELDMLSLCQIETLRKLLTERFGRIRGIGAVASDIIDEEGEHSDTAFVSSVDHIVKLIEEDDEELKQMNILLLPVPAPAKDDIVVVFDGNWSAGTGGKNPRRWLVNRGTGGILFLNNHEYPVASEISFNLTSLMKGALVRISQGQNSTMVHFHKKAAHITLNTILLPGENRLSFRFLGTTEETEEITNIGVSRLAIDGVRNDMAADMKRLGTGYYAAVYPDGKVRNVLHNSGYSEIECIRLYHDNVIQREKTTRFLQHDPNSSGDSFYVLKEGEKQKDTSASLRLYIARKTGVIE